MVRYAEQTQQEFEGWEEFISKPVDEKLEAFKLNGRIFDVIYAQQFDRELLDSLGNLADMIRLLAKTRVGQSKLRHLLPHKRAMLYFVQPSTRTFLSFQNACHILGLTVSEIRGTSTSSEVKGESPEDTIRTFASYVDLIISRHPEAGFAEKTAWVLNQTDHPVPVLNGGSGPDQHPTQALLDIYTLEREFRTIGGLDGKKIAMVGDLKRGRTVRSLSYLMKNYKDVELVYVAPEVFKMKDDIKEFLDFFISKVAGQGAGESQGVAPLDRIGHSYVLLVIEIVIVAADAVQITVDGFRFQSFIQEMIDKCQKLFMRHFFDRHIQP